MTYVARFPGEKLVDVDDYAEHLRDYDGYMMLQERAMRKSKAGAQTLAALLKFVNAKTMTTFASIPTIAEHACLNVKEVRRHLEKFVSLNMVKNLGRQKPDGAREARRTCTWAVSKALLRGSEKYIELPRWAAQRLTRWSDRAVYAAVLSRRLSIERWESNGGCAEERSAFSARRIQLVTGISERSVWMALAHLQDLGYIERIDNGDGGDWTRLVLPKCFANAILPDGIDP